ncbi:MAG: methyltransferase domain-containing protein [Antricoccus sp.]
MSVNSAKLNTAITTIPSDRYTHGHHESVLRSHATRSAQNSAAYLLPRLSPDMKILDVGCGPGTITIDLGECVPRGIVIGIEPSEGILDFAKAMLHRSPVRNVRFLVGDVYDLNFGGDYFDVVHAHQVLQHLSDPVRALKEMARVCRPGGYLAIRDADYGAMNWYPHEPELDTWMNIYQQIARSNNAQPNAGRYLKRWMRESGLTDVEFSVGSYLYSSAAETRWWADVWSERAVSSDYAARAIELGLADAAGLQQIAEGFQRWGADPDATFMIPNTQVLARVSPQMERAVWAIAEGDDRDQDSED